MSLSQSLPTTYAANPTGATTRLGGLRTLSVLPSCVFTLTSRLVRTATDSNRLSVDTLRDIGLFWGEPSYAGVPDHRRMDDRL